MPTNDEALGQFLLELLPDEPREGLRRLAELRYPIPDRRSMAEQLGAGAKPEEARLASGLLAAFEAEDFGLDTLQSALEKYRRRAPWSLGAALPIDDAGRRTLEGAIAGGGLQFTGTSMMARGRGNVGVNADCSCSGTSGSCEIIIAGGVLYCGTGTCAGTCDLVVTIPTKFFAAIA